MIENNNNKEKTSTKEKAPMEMNRLAISLLSVLITLAIALAGFAYQTGAFNNELRNLKNSQQEQKKDFENDLVKIEQKKADLNIVELMMKKIDENNKENYEQHILIMNKLDKIMALKTGEKE